MVYFIGFIHAILQRRKDRIKVNANIMGLLLGEATMSFSVCLPSEGSTVREFAPLGALKVKQRPRGQPRGRSGRNSFLTPIALRKAKTLWSFDNSECNRVKLTDSLF